jgi:hypothetical protein|nr:MAG TPA: hypothetical protein [Caudoviricetes sp.]DAQ47899.1 MAG TPA: hypothetical protein [Caudoviricetes sp.]
MNKQQQFQEQLEQLAEKFGYDIQYVNFSHVISNNFSTNKEFNRVNIEMTTTAFDDTLIKKEDKNLINDVLEDMRKEFYEDIELNNIKLSKLPATAPLKIISTMFQIAKDGQTKAGWKKYYVLLGLINGELNEINSKY